MGFLKILEEIVDGTPLLGHLKGIVHYLTGEKENGHKCMYNATRSTVTLGAGMATGGFGVLVAVGAGAGAGFVYDCIVSLMRKTPVGYIEDIINLLKQCDLASARACLLRLVGDMMSGGFGSTETLALVLSGTPVIGPLIIDGQVILGNKMYGGFVWSPLKSMIVMFLKAFLKNKFLQDAD